MNKRNLNNYANKYVFDVLPQLLHYKRLSVNNCNLFTKSEDVVDIPGSEITYIMGWLKENYIKKENKNEPFRT